MKSLNIEVKIGLITIGILTAILVCYVARQPKVKLPSISTTEDFTMGIQIGYYIASKGGNKDDISLAITHWQQGRITTFINQFEHEHPRNTQVTN